jgi:hypothetical protein
VANWGQGRSSRSKKAPGSAHDHVGLSRCKSGLTSDGPPDVEDLEAGSKREELSATPEPGYFWPATATLVHMKSRKPPLVTGSDIFSAWFVKKNVKCGKELIPIRSRGRLQDCHSDHNKRF